MSLAVNGNINKTSFRGNGNHLLKMVEQIRIKQNTDTLVKAMEKMQAGDAGDLHLLAKANKLEIPKGQDILEFCVTIAEKIGADTEHVTKWVENQRIINGTQKELDNFNLPGLDPKYFKHRLDNFGKFNQ
jgi:hypothetical protein